MIPDGLDRAPEPTVFGFLPPPAAVGAVFVRLRPGAVQRVHDRGTPLQHRPAGGADDRGMIVDHVEVARTKVRRHRVVAVVPGVAEERGAANLTQDRPATEAAPETATGAAGQDGSGVANRTTVQTRAVIRTGEIYLANPADPRGPVLCFEHVVEGA